MPLPNNSLRYVLVYLFETDRGPYLIDAGWNTDDAFGALPERHGGGRLRHRGRPGCHGDAHPPRSLRPGRPDPGGVGGLDLPAPGRRRAHPRPLRRARRPARPGGRRAPPHGRAPRGARAAAQRGDAGAALVDAVVPDVLLEDGARPEVPGWDLQAIWTPGHSPGHLCFYESRNELMLSGDHVLPRITPNIPFHPQAGANPLGDFLQSLDKLEPYQVNEVLPAHEYRFTDLHRRLEELRQHHRERFVEVIEILREGPQTAWYIAAHMKWSRSWDDIAGFMRRAAVGETVSHLARARDRRHRGGRGRRARPLVADRPRRGLSTERGSGPVRRRGRQVSPRPTPPGRAGRTHARDASPTPVGPACHASGRGRRRPTPPTE